MFPNPNPSPELKFPSWAWSNSILIPMEYTVPIFKAPILGLYNKIV